MLVQSTNISKSRAGAVERNREWYQIRLPPWGYYSSRRRQTLARQLAGYKSLLRRHEHMVKESILVWGSKKVSLVREISQEGVSGPGLSVERLYHNDKCPTPAHRTLEGEDTWKSVKMEAWTFSTYSSLSSKANRLVCPILLPQSFSQPVPFPL